MHYQHHFQLKEAPFSIAPDPRYLYLTENHREALAHLLYGVTSNGGFVLLTGDIGAGKTTVCQCMLEQLPENTNVAYILNPKLQPWEFLAAICDELGIGYSAENRGVKHYTDRIADYLVDAHGKGCNTVLMVDEAQNLDVEMMEHLRLLTNLETREKKLLQIMLVGQPELGAIIDRPDMEQMKQRITARCHLAPLKQSELSAYVEHRLAVAGTDKSIFTERSLDALWKLTQGVPRIINIVCDRAMLGAFVSGKTSVEEDVLRTAAKEIMGERAIPSGNSHQKYLRFAGMAALLLAAVAVGYLLRSQVELGSVEQSAADLGRADRTEAVLGELSSPPIAVEYIAAPLSDASATVNVAATTHTENTSEMTSKAAVETVATALELEEVVGAMVLDPVAAEAIETETETDVADVGAKIVPNEQEAIEDPVLGLVFPALNDSARSRELAFRSLFAQWGVDYAVVREDSNCEYAREYGLGCQAGRINLAQLRELNRPMVLTLHDPLGNTFEAALLSVRGLQAEVWLNGKRQTITVDKLEEAWSGEYFVLWRFPSGYRFPQRKGATGEAITWLAIQLDEEHARETGRFDDDLEEKLKLYQSQNGLLADGILGPMTVIALQNSAGSAGPTLAPDGAGAS
ncbi:MAG: AAA family ATPase [Halioglobus sp.]